MGLSSCFACGNWRGWRVCGRKAEAYSGGGVRVGGTGSDAVLGVDGGDDVGGSGTSAA